MTIGYQITAPNGDVYAVFVNADDKAREFTLGTAFAHLRKAEVLADENQAGPVGIAKPQGLEWTEKGLKLNALTAVVLRLPQGGAIVAQLWKKNQNLIFLAWKPNKTKPKT